MKYFYPLLFLIILFSCDEDKGDKVSLKSPFQEEKEYEIEVINSIENTAFQGVGQQTVTKIKFKVNSVSDTIINGIWQIGETTIAGTKQTDEQPTQNLSQFRGIQLGLNYNTKTGGITIANFEEVHGDLENAFVKFYNPNGDADSSDLYLQVKESFLANSSNEEMLISNYFPEVKVLFSEINKDYVLNQKFLIDSFRPDYTAIYAPVYSSAKVKETEDGEIELTRKDTASHSDFINRLKNVIVSKYGEAAADTIPFHEFRKVKYEVEANILSDENNEVSSIEIIKTEGGMKGDKTTRQVINILESE